MAPTVLLDAAFFLPAFSPDESEVILHEPQKTSDLSTVVGVGQFLIASILPSSVATPLAKIMFPR